MTAVINARELLEQISEDALGEHVRDACAKLGWRFLWIREVRASSSGALDLTLIPVRDRDRRHPLFRELKGFRRNGRLGPLTYDDQRKPSRLGQFETIAAMQAAGLDAGMWLPADWFSGRILEELA